jgi:flagellar P-ring protein precursor FlgI
MNRLCLHAALIVAISASGAYAQAQVTNASLSPAVSDRVKDLASVGGVRSNQLVGYGIVVGLNGTGDGNVAATSQTVQSLMQRFGLTVDANAVNAKNTAAVMVTAELPPFAKPGQRIDVTVAALSKATSLRGGALLITQLIGSDNETYAVAQGNLAVGGLGIAGNDGSKVTVNVPTVGRIPGGARSNAW